MTRRHHHRNLVALDRRAAAGVAERVKKYVPMTTAELEAAMKRVIRRKLADGETISLEDFRLVGLPIDQVQPEFKRVLAKVQNSIAAECT